MPPRKDRNGDAVWRSQPCVLSVPQSSLSQLSLPPAEPAASQQPEYRPAKQLKLDLKWPGEADREAYVIVEFDVLANCKTANVRLRDEGFHEPRFANAALKAVKQSTWEPRRVDGVPVDALGLRKGFVFAIKEMKPGVTKAFLEEAKKVEDLVQQGDFAGGEFHAQWMLAEKVKLNYEYAVLQAQLAQTYAGLGRIEDAVRKLREATSRSASMPEFLQVLDKPPPNSPSNYLLEKELVLKLLAFRMRLLAEQGFALAALQAYYELAGLEPPPPGDPHFELAAQLTAQVRGNGPLRGKVEIRAEGGWNQFFSRRRFALENVKDGFINGLYLRCEAGTREFDYAPGDEWVVPEGMGLCKVSVVAEPGTTFSWSFPMNRRQAC